MTDDEYKASLIIALREQGFLAPRAVAFRARDGVVKFKIYHGVADKPGERSSFVIEHGADVTKLRGVHGPVQDQADNS